MSVSRAMKRAGFITNEMKLRKVERALDGYPNCYCGQPSCRQIVINYISLARNILLIIFNQE